jgi:hypothetical protein
MTTFFLRNLKSSQLCRAELADLAARPSTHHRFKTKPEQKAWNALEATDHCFYSLFEPKDPTQRLTVKANPVARLHGLVADFDAKISDDMLAKAVRSMPADWPASFTTKTFSGGCRILWVFERPIEIVSTDLAKEFLAGAAKSIGLARLLPGFDEPAFMDTAKVFELGANWVSLNPGTLVSSNLVTKIRFDAAQKVNWRRHDGPAIPIHEVAAEVERRWPGRWRGPFEVGSQGVRFWSSTSDNIHGCWIRENGVVAFSGENKFMPWGEVLGEAFVKKYEADRIGGAISNTYYDGHAFWVKTADGFWQTYNTELLKNRLRVRGLSGTPQKGQPSEVDKAVDHLVENARLDGGYAFLFDEREVVTLGSNRYLNLSRVRAAPPADGPRTWGQEFPWIAGYLNEIFRGDQLDAFLSWHRHFWFNAWKCRPSKGHALFIVGPAGLGKTLLNYHLIGGSVGGYTDCSDFLQGKTEFNKELFESPLGCIDDAVGAADRRSHDVYSQMVKKIVANPRLTYRRMYADPILIPYFGRLVVTLNDDAVSTGMLPTTDGSIVDKMIFLKASARTNPFVGNEEETIRRELPAYLAFLRDYKVPESLQGEVRFGMKAYKHPELMLAAQSGSKTAEVRDLIEMWKEQYFRQEGGEDWTGRASDLYVDMQNTDTVRRLCDATIRNTNYLGKMLKQLACEPDSGVTVAPRSSHGTRYSIARDVAAIRPAA